MSKQDFPSEEGLVWAELPWWGRTWTTQRREKDQTTTKAIARTLRIATGPHTALSHSLC